MKDRLKAALHFIIEWLSTPTSKIGISALIVLFAGNKLAPQYIEGLAYLAGLLASAILVAWPQKKQ